MLALHEAKARKGVKPLLPRILTTQRNGSEPFRLGDVPLDRKVAHFWRWAASDFLGNTFRGWLAEYIVAVDFGVDTKPRNDWEAYDLTFAGLKIEVKSSAYIQSWSQLWLSRPKFSIRPARAWDPDTNEFLPDIKRHSDVYVFAVQHYQDQASLDPLDFSQWTFLVVPTSAINMRHPTQKSIGLASIKALGATGVSFGQVRAAVSAVGDGVREAV